jgi:hypothetical protein
MTDPLFFGEDLGAGSNKLYGTHGGIQLQAVVAADTGQQVSQLLGFRNRKPPMKIMLCFLRQKSGWSEPNRVDS